MRELKCFQYCLVKEKKYYYTGSHGKTTTTSLVSKILLESKLDPTIINVRRNKFY